MKNETACELAPIVFLALLSSLCITSTSFATVWTVDDDGKADFNNIQAAIDAALDGDEIVVMPGTYTSTQDGHVVNTLGKAIRLRSLDPEDPTVVAATIIDGEGIRRGIGCFNNETNETIVEGFTVQHCHTMDFDYNGDGEVSSYEWDGAGMYCYASSPTITNCLFVNNVAYDDGGAVNCITLSNPIFTNCTFSNNVASDEFGLGGGVYVIQSCNPTFTNCVFSNNSSLGGGGLCLYKFCYANIENCTITNNSSVNWGGGIYAHTSSNATIINSTISNNSSGADGAGLFSNASNPTLVDTLLCGNTPYQVLGGWFDGGNNCIATSCDDSDGDGWPDMCGSIGDGVHMVPQEYATIQAAIDAAGNDDEVLIAPGTYTITSESINPRGKRLWIHSSDGPELTIIDGFGDQSTFIFVSGETKDTIIEGLTLTGGAVQCNYSDPTIKNCIFTENHSQFYGGGLHCLDSDLAIIDCVFDSNSAGSNGGGIYCYDGSPTVTNTIFINNSAGGMGINQGGGGLYSLHSHMAVENCVFKNNTAYQGSGVYSRMNNSTIKDTLFCGNSSTQIDGLWIDLGWNLFMDDCTDCNGNGIDDLQDILDGTSFDCDQNGMPDECQFDCDGDGVPDPTELFCYNTAHDIDGDGHPDDCQPDCDGDGIPDEYAIAIGFSFDCDGNGIPDSCETDCNGNGLLDACDIEDGSSDDINGDAIPDDCQCLADANGDDVVDVIDVLLVISQWNLSGGTADVNYSGFVDVHDMLMIVDNWGSCP